MKKATPAKGTPAIKNGAAAKKAESEDDDDDSGRLLGKRQNPSLSLQNGFWLLKSAEFCNKFMNWLVLFPSKH